jgi:hypothetical protein
MPKRKFEMAFYTKGTKSQDDCFVESDDSHDLVTKKSITRICLMLNDTPFILVFNGQKTLEKSISYN